jgi:hypothetical protein
MPGSDIETSSEATFGKESEKDDPNHGQKKNSLPYLIEVLQMIAFYRGCRSVSKKGWMLKQVVNCYGTSDLRTCVYAAFYDVRTYYVTTRRNFTSPAYLRGVFLSLIRTMDLF